MSERDEAGLPAGSTASTSIVYPAVNPDNPTVVVERSRLARWIEMAEFGIENPRDAIDALLEIAASIEDVWLAPEAAA